MAEPRDADAHRARTLLLRMGLSPDDHRIGMLADALVDARAEVAREAVMRFADRLADIVADRCETEKEASFMGECIGLAVRAERKAGR
jgi:hypothetical protein